MRKDAIVLIFLFLFVVLFALTCIDFSIAPFEDAAMIMRYAGHFAGGHGMVWNIGEKPADGATDFLFVIILGLFIKAGMSLEYATRFRATDYYWYDTGRKSINYALLATK